MTAITVRKLNPENQETWRYTGQVLQLSPNWILLEARFNRPDLPFHGVVLGEGDRFVEAYFTGRWFNIFEIYGRDDNRLKGWYCNVTQPAVVHKMAEGQVEVSYVDLFLDLLVYPNGRQLVLDEDEFAAACLGEDVRRKAQGALADLQAVFQQNKPFQLEKWLAQAL
jgi:uncharacterized protein